MGWTCDPPSPAFYSHSGNQLQKEAHKSPRWPSERVNQSSSLIAIGPYDFHELVQAFLNPNKSVGSTVSRNLHTFPGRQFLMHTFAFYPSTNNSRMLIIYHVSNFSEITKISLVYLFRNTRLVGYSKTCLFFKINFWLRLGYFEKIIGRRAV